MQNFGYNDATNSTHPTALITTSQAPQSFPDANVPPLVYDGIQQAAWASLLTLSVLGVVLWRVALQLSHPIGRFFDRQGQQLDKIDDSLSTSNHQSAEVSKTLTRVESKLESIQSDLHRLRQ